jgi:predicted transcriptional regulator of viral defense system
MQKGHGLFPSPKEIHFSCSCPDWAYMCKHVAAVLYGIGARMDQDPALFFVLRQVNMDDLIAKALKDTAAHYIQRAEEKHHPVVAEADLGSVFGIDMDAMPDFGKMVSEAVQEPAANAKPSKKAKPAKKSSGNTPKKEAVDEKMLIIELVQKATNGINAAGLHAETGIDVIKIRNVLYQACRKGIIRKAGRGIFKAQVIKTKRTAMADRLAAVLAVIEAAHKGIRAPRVAEETGLLLATVRPAMARLLKTGEIRKISRGRYGPPVKRRRKKSESSAIAVLTVIQTHPEGIAFAALKAQSGVEEKQLRNIVFRLFRSGKVRRAGRGIYVAVSERK